LVAVGAVVAMLAGLPAAARADVTWTLSDVAFADGGTASGSFVTDGSGALLSFDITTTAGSVMRAETFDSATGGTTFDSTTVAIGINSDDTTENMILTAASGSFVAANGGVPVVFADNSSSYVSNAGLAEVEELVSGEAIPVAAPEPVSGALLVTGLVGLAASRRRRKA
jgi:hypothetical protein